MNPPDSDRKKEYEDGMKKRVLSFIMAAGLLLTMAGCKENEKTVVETSEKTETVTETKTEDKTEPEKKPVSGDIVDGIVLVDTGAKVIIPENDALSFTRDMEIGWSLGNAFDAKDCDWLSDELDYETGWCGAKTSKELISKLKEAGFKTIRIPVSWHNHVDSQDKISEAWLDRVEEVVSWAYDEGMYVVLNIHHDDDPDYMYPSYECLDRSKQYIANIWEQLAARFADYDEHLIFEVMNEPRMVGTEIEWWIEDPDIDLAKEAFDCINQMNQVGVDTIRANGQGYNSSRYIMVPGYVASPEYALVDEFKLPDDSNASAENRLIVAIHAYTPYDFALNRSGTKVFDIATRNGTDDIDWFMKRIYEKFIAKGTPVLVGEFGALDKDNLECRMQFTAYYVAMARKYGLTCFVWDNNAYKTDGENFMLIDRTTLEWKFPEIVDQMMYYCTERE